MKKSLLALSAVLALTVVSCKKVKAETKSLSKQTVQKLLLQTIMEK
ncbi:hypothetical protein [Chryseobacterium sp. PCH239]|nr:hypothetical protein [Chryseobacterium sp. PCH239]